MFFIGILGINQKEKFVQEIEKIPCSTCSTDPSGTLLKEYSYFHVFFIPIIKWNIKYVIVCNDCHQGFYVSKEKGQDIEQGKGLLTYWDLKPIMPLLKKCMYCGALLDVAPNYCPNCGKQLK